MKIVVALMSGIIFGLGLGISQMTDPAVVIGFLDVFGQWDPSLALVMGGALLVTFPVSRWALKPNKKPLFDSKYHLPHQSSVDAKLVTGSVIFGIGWGLAGYCPGPLFSSLSFSNTPVLTVFLGYSLGTVSVMIMRRIADKSAVSAKMI